MDEHSNTHVENIEMGTPHDTQRDCIAMGLQWFELIPEVDQRIVEMIDAELAVRLRVATNLYRRRTIAHCNAKPRRY